MNEDEKREHWERIKRELPEFAEACIEVNKQLGKPESVIVEQ